MSEFSINEAARAQIQHILLQSSCRDPVARMYERADPGNLFDDFRAEVLDGVKTTEELGAMGRRRFEEVGDQLQSSLMVGADERAEFRPEDLCDIGGITFVVGPGVAEMLREYCLTFENGRFVFRGPDNMAHTLRSLAKKR